MSMNQQLPCHFSNEKPRDSSLFTYISQHALRNHQVIATKNLSSYPTLDQKGFSSQKQLLFLKKSLSKN